MIVPNVETMHRTALLSAHAGTYTSFEEVLSGHQATGLVVLVDADTCRSPAGQAAVCTAMAVAARGFGTAVLVGDGVDTVMSYGPYAGSSIAAAASAEGVRVLPDLTEVPAHYPVLVVGRTPGPTGVRNPMLRAWWVGWTASAGPADVPAAAPTDAVDNIIAAVCATALGVHEAFEVVRGRPSGDCGRRTVVLNLWSPGADVDGPRLAYAPAGWWLVGLGHLGQANAWVISWLPYADPAGVRAVLQDTDTAVPANHSTGLLTPRDPGGVRKTRLVASVLDGCGLDTFVVERRLDHTLRRAGQDPDVALIGVDNLAARRLISEVGWPLAIDAGLGAGPGDYDAILLRRFPGARASDQIPAWADDAAPAVIVPDSPAFTDLNERSACGAVQLAGTAVGAAFVGAVAACLCVAEAVRAVYGVPGLDTLSLHLQSDDLVVAARGDAPAVVPARLLLADAGAATAD